MYTVTVNNNVIWQSAQIVDGADQLLIAGSVYLRNGGADCTIATTVILSLDGAIIRHSTRDRTQTMSTGR
jgi:hypothetical protein